MSPSSRCGGSSLRRQELEDIEQGLSFPCCVIPELRLGPLPAAVGFVRRSSAPRPRLTTFWLASCRPDQVSAVDSYQYDDGCEPCGNDTFSREPAIVKFFSPFTRECWTAEDPLPCLTSRSLLTLPREDHITCCLPMPSALVLC